MAGHLPAAVHPQEVMQGLQEEQVLTEEPITALQGRHLQDRMKEVAAPVEQA